MHLTPATAALTLSLVVASVRAQTAESLIPPSLVYELLALNGDLSTVQRPRFLSPDAMALSPDRQTLYVCEQTSKQIAVVELASQTVAETIAVPNEPTGLALSSDGSTLYATCSSDRWPNGIVVEITTSTGRIERTFRAGHMARSPVLTADGAHLYVCNWLENTVSLIAVATGTTESTVDVGREPYSAVLSNDGERLLVSCILPDEKSTDINRTGCKVRFVDTRTNLVAETVPLPVGSHSAWGIALSPDGRHAFVSHLLGRFMNPATQLSQGLIHSNNLAIVDVAARALVNDVMLDDANQGYASPWGVACNGDGTVLCVLHAGVNSMTLIDLPGLLPRAEAMPDLSRSFSFLEHNALKQVVALPLKSPRCIVVDDTIAYVAARFSDSLAVVGVGEIDGTVQGAVALGPGMPMTMERKGEWLYQDASLCYENWQSCFSCHPSNRCDGLNWILSSSPNNAPKNVRNHVYAWWTPRTGWDQRRDGAWESIEKGIQLELQTIPTAEITLPLDTFMMRLKPVASPYLEKGRLSESAARGLELFATDRVDCSNCHVPPRYFTPEMQASGITDPFDSSPVFDVPTLVECWRTAPYGHIGSELTVEDMANLPGISFTYFQLNPQEQADLVRFIESL